MIKENKIKLSVSALCQQLEVQRSGYYNWEKTIKEESLTKKRRLSLEIEARNIHKESRHVYGYLRVHQMLKRRGFTFGKNTVARAMKRASIFGKYKRRFVPKTTDSKHLHPIAERIFKVEEGRKGQAVWVSDITYLKTGTTWSYLTIVLDIDSRKVVGWGLETSLHSNGVLKALQMALVQEGHGHRIFHSDRGVQYASELIRSFNNRNGLTPSMSRKGNCYDNAYAESFFSTLKREQGETFDSYEKAQKSLFEYIEVIYNRKRLHSSLGYMSPQEYLDSNKKLFINVSDILQ